MDEIKCLGNNILCAISKNVLVTEKLNYTYPLYQLPLTYQQSVPSPLPVCASVCCFVSLKFPASLDFRMPALVVF